VARQAICTRAREELNLQSQQQNFISLKSLEQQVVKFILCEFIIKKTREDAGCAPALNQFTAQVILSPALNAREKNYKMRKRERKRWRLARL